MPCPVVRLELLASGALAVELGQRFVAAHPPRSIIGWATAYAVYAGRNRLAAALPLWKKAQEATERLIPGTDTDRLRADLLALS